MASTPQLTEELLDQVQSGNDKAIEKLLNETRPRLKRMILVRLDRRLSSRLDASDVVQETLVEVVRRLPEYLRTRPLPFYVWIRRIAWERLVNLHKHHLRTMKRRVSNEANVDMALPDDSLIQLASQMAVTGTTPSRNMIRGEMQSRIRDALHKLPANDREVLVLRFLEEMSISEAAAELEISEGAVSMRQLRALLRLRDSLDDQQEELIE